MRDEGTGTGIILETERLFLREMDRNDYDALYRVLADTEIMCHYPYTFDEARVRAWIERNIDRYRVNGFGLWAVCLKESGEMIGDCGLTIQIINGNVLPEIGYHIRRNFQRRGYAKEAAKAVRVDPDIILLELYYILVVFGYLAFEMVPINYRPILIHGALEASYPSSTTLLVLSVMPTLVFQVNRRCERKTVKRTVSIFVVLFSAFMVIGRSVSGVHWATETPRISGSSKKAAFVPMGSSERKGRALRWTAPALWKEQDE